MEVCMLPPRMARIILCIDAAFEQLPWGYFWRTTLIPFPVVGPFECQECLLRFSWWRRCWWNVVGPAGIRCRVVEREGHGYCICMRPCESKRARVCWSWMCVCSKFFLLAQDLVLSTRVLSSFQGRAICKSYATSLQVTPTTKKNNTCSAEHASKLEGFTWGYVKPARALSWFVQGGT